MNILYSKYEFEYKNITKNVKSEDELKIFYIKWKKRLLNKQQGTLKDISVLILGNTGLSNNKNDYRMYCIKIYE